MSICFIVDTYHLGIDRSSNRFAVNMAELKGMLTDLNASWERFSNK
jgi:hypothetical protein